MARIQCIRPQWLISSPALSHVSTVPPRATTIHVRRSERRDVVDIAAEPASDAPALVTGARVAEMGVPGALVVISEARRSIAMKVRPTPERRGR